MAQIEPEKALYDSDPCLQEWFDLHSSVSLWQQKTGQGRILQQNVQFGHGCRDSLNAQRNGFRQGYLLRWNRLQYEFDRQELVDKQELALAGLWQFERSLIISAGSADRNQLIRQYRNIPQGISWPVWGGGMLYQERGFNLAANLVNDLVQYRRVSLIDSKRDSWRYYQQSPMFSRDSVSQTLGSDSGFSAYRGGYTTLDLFAKGGLHQSGLSAFFGHFSMDKSQLGLLPPGCDENNGNCSDNNIIISLRHLPSASHNLSNRIISSDNSQLVGYVTAMLQHRLGANQPQYSGHFFLENAHFFFAGFQDAATSQLSYSQAIAHRLLISQQKQYANYLHHSSIMGRFDSHWQSQQDQGLVAASFLPLGSSWCLPLKIGFHQFSDYLDQKNLAAGLQWTGKNLKTNFLIRYAQTKAHKSRSQNLDSGFALTWLLNEHWLLYQDLSYVVNHSGRIQANNVGDNLVDEFIPAIEIEKENELRSQQQVTGRQQAFHVLDNDSAMQKFSYAMSLQWRLKSSLSANLGFRWQRHYAATMPLFYDPLDRISFWHQQSGIMPVFFELQYWSRKVGLSLKLKRYGPVDMPFSSVSFSLKSQF